MRLFSMLAVGLVAGSMVLSGCNSDPVKSNAETVVVNQTTTLFESHANGRIYSFYDQKTYEDFNALGETPFQLTRIASGPKGETIVYGLTKADKKKGVNTPAVMLMDGKTEVQGEFYGEIRKDGRIYVFNQKADMDFVRSVGEPVYMFTQIGSGPKGETVVYVLNKSNKKKKPDALMAKFAAMQAK